MYLFASFLTLSSSPADFGDFKDLFFAENNLKLVMDVERIPLFIKSESFDSLALQQLCQHSSKISFPILTLQVSLWIF